MAELLVLQHTEGAGPSAFTEVLDGRTAIAPWRLIAVAAPEDVPDAVDDVAGVIVLGGTMSAREPDEVPWMPAELDLLRAALDVEVPVLGVCLGAQLLGATLDGKVTRRDTPQVGYLAVKRTEDAPGDPVFGGWQDGAAQLFFHEDEVSEFPEDAVPMLTTDDGVVGWRVGSAWAVQFHPEVTADQLARWMEIDGVERLLAEAGADADGLLDEARRRDRSVVPVGRALVGRFIDAVVRPRLES